MQRNGLVERHNTVIAETFGITKGDINFSLKMALAWALKAKNSKQNIHGFSLNELAFDPNPDFPSVLTDSLPSLEGTTSTPAVDP